MESSSKFERNSPGVSGGDKLKKEEEGIGGIEQLSVREGETEGSKINSWEIDMEEEGYSGV